MSTQKANPKPKITSKQKKAGKSPPIWKTTKEEIYCVLRGGLDPEIYPVTKFYKQFGEPVVSSAATIAAILSKGNISPAEAVTQAYELLNLSAGGWLALTKPETEGWWSFDAGIQQAKMEREKELEKCKEWHNLPADLVKLSDDGSTCHIDFQEALVKRMLRGYSAKRRLKLFNDWCSELLEVSTERTAMLVEQWKQKGMPPLLFREFWIGFQMWKEQKTSNVRSKAGKTGQVSKKKRKARPPETSQADKIYLKVLAEK